MTSIRLGPLASAEAPLEVQVVALDWKWLFIYPQQGRGQHQPPRDPRP